MFKVRTIFPIYVISIVSILMGCNATNTNDAAAAAIKIYWQAMVERDLNKVINVSCANWETQAGVEFNSFSAVKLALDNVDCHVKGHSDPYTLVACTGSIIANYGAEDLTIDIANRTFLVMKEGGEWRMCGYQQ